MKKCLSLILTVLLLLTMVPTGAVSVAAVEEPVPVAAKTGGAHFDVSGDLNVSKPTKEEIKAMWRTTTHNTANKYVEEPSVSAPYKAGKLTDEFLDNGLTYLNYVRYVAGLPAVQLDASLNENAQYGAVILAANDVLTHYPEQPADMDDDFYSQAAAATGSSNLGVGYRTLADHIQGGMDDDGYSNIARVGHRRWLLNPTLLNVGFGFAESDSYYGYYSATKVFDSSGEGCDFDFVAWPPSGNFPTHLLSEFAPWSITLNPDEYKKPVLEDLRITIQRESDGETWILDGKTDTSDILTGYLTVETSYYGINNCIIFHPGWDYIDGYNGVYTVEIQGLYTRGGEEADLCYQVDFFDVLSGPVGDCWWEIEGTHMTVSGQGAMKDQISSYTFSEYNFTSVTIEEGVTAIGAYTFSNCPSLVSVTIPDSVTSIGQYAFNECSSLTAVIIPDNVTSIGEGAFWNCSSLASVTMGDGVTTIGTYTFAGCNALSTVKLSEGLTAIGDDAFNNCRSLTSLIIPDSVITIGDDAFYYCNSLMSVVFGDSVTTIGEWTFAYCTSLTEMTLPNSITIIGEVAFYGCDALTDVYYSGMQADREKIEIGEFNYSLDWATWHYNYGLEPEIIHGDLDADGKVNNRDLGLLQRHLNGWDIAIDLVASDVNGDGNINNRDLGLLQRYLNGWDVTLG